MYLYRRVRGVYSKGAELNSSWSFTVVKYINYLRELTEPRVFHSIFWNDLIFIKNSFYPIVLSNYFLRIAFWLRYTSFSIRSTIVFSIEEQMKNFFQVPYLHPMFLLHYRYNQLFHRRINNCQMNYLPRYELGGC